MRNLFKKKSEKIPQQTTSSTDNIWMGKGFSFPPRDNESVDDFVENLKNHVADIHAVPESTTNPRRFLGGLRSALKRSVRNLKGGGDV